MESIYNNDNIIKALLFRKESSNFLDKTIYSNLDRTSLLYNQIYPWMMVPQVESEPNAFVTSRFVYKPHDHKFMISNFYLYSIVYRTWMSTDYGLLTDFLADEIRKNIHNSHLLGIGKVGFAGMTEGSFDKDGNWLYNCIEFQTYDFH